MSPRPAPHAVAQAYAQAVRVSSTSNVTVVLEWVQGSLHLDWLEPGQSPHEYPVYVSPGLTTYYPWCPDTGVRCVGWPSTATQDDIATALLESGWAQRLADQLCIEMI